MGTVKMLCAVTGGAWMVRLPRTQTKNCSYLIQRLGKIEFIHLSLWEVAVKSKCLKSIAFDSLRILSRKIAWMTGFVFRPAAALVLS